MKRLLLIVLPVLLIVGCSHTRHTPFITDNQLKLIRLGDNENMLKTSLGKPLLELKINDTTKILEYHFRFFNKLNEKLPSPWFWLFHSFDETSGWGNKIVFSGQTDHRVLLTLKNNNLVEIKIDNEVYTN
jgi:hypothetical protein